MRYGNLLNKVFNHFGVIETKGTPRIVKQNISLTILVENECIKGQVGTVSQVFELLVSQERSTKEVKELRIVLEEKDTDIGHLKLQNQMLSSEDKVH